MQVIYDDGNIPDLSALANIRSVSGPLIVYGNYNASLKNLAGLEGIKVTECQFNSSLGSPCVVPLASTHLNQESSHR